MRSENGLAARSGRSAPTWLSVSLVLAAMTQPAFAQQRPPVSKTAPVSVPHPAPLAPSAVPVPDQLTALRMVWGIMAAVDQANRTGNYSVLRDLGSTGFQANNNPTTLAGVFGRIRTQQIDTSAALLVSPTWEIPPRMTSATVLRMRGTFPLRPAPIAFDLLFAWERGGWRLEGVAVQPLDAAR